MDQASFLQLLMHVDWRAAFDAATLTRADTCVREHRVSQLRYPESAQGRLKGTVRTTGHAPYRCSVNVFESDGPLVSTCMCSIGHGCEHVAAILLACTALSAPPAAVEILQVQPTPVLRLRSLRAARERHGRTVHEILGCAHLFFDYANHRMQPDEMPRLRQLADGRHIEVVSNRAAELAVYERFEELSLLDAQLLAPLLSEGAEQLGDGDFVLERGRGEIASPDHWLPLLPRLANEGIQVEFDASFPIEVLPPTEKWVAEIDDSAARWFDVSLGIVINGERIDLLPILRRALSDPSFPLKPTAHEADDAMWLAPLDERRRIPLPLKRVRALIAPLLEWLENSGGMADGHLRLHRAQASVIDELARGTGLPWHGGESLREQIAKLREHHHAVDAPPGFLATLRPYQQEGLAWLGFLAKAGLGGILADDMGLGKTVQVLAHVLAEYQAQKISARLPTLVIAPTSLVANWRAEAARFAPQLRVLVLHGSARESQFKLIPTHDLIITTYPLLVRDRDVLLEHAFGLLVLDEAQMIKNAQTQTAKVVREIKAARHIAMTGTPLENHLGELWAQFDAVEPGLLGGERQFTRAYRTPIEKHADADTQAMLNRRIAPLLLRRRKQDVLKDLPPKTEILRLVELEDRQRELYETLRLAQHDRVREALEHRGLGQSGIVVLDALLKLRQVCCDPRLVKLDAARGVEESAKLNMLLELLDQLVAEDRRVLVFSQFTEMLGLIAAALDARKIDYLMLTGQTKARAPLVERFQRGEVPVFLVSLKAGGVGLNLTAADTVIHYDPWWNPAVEAQASDRAHRIGQDKSVFVYKLICSGTVEEKIMALQTRKAELATAVLEGGSTQSLRFDEEDLAELFGPL